MSAITSAFAELLAVQTAEVEPSAPTITIGSDTVACIIGGSGFDKNLFDGGLADTGTIDVQALRSSFSAMPAKMATATLANMVGTTRVLQVVDVRENNGVLTITLGDAASR